MLCPLATCQVKKEGRPAPLAAVGAVGRQHSAASTEANAAKIAPTRNHIGEELALFSW